MRGSRRRYPRLRKQQGKIRAAGQASPRRPACRPAAMQAGRSSRQSQRFRLCRSLERTRPGLPPAEEPHDCFFQKAAGPTGRRLRRPRRMRKAVGKQSAEGWPFSGVFGCPCPGAAGRAPDFEPSFMPGGSSAEQGRLPAGDAGAPSFMLPVLPPSGPRSVGTAVPCDGESGGTAVCPSASPAARGLALRPCRMRRPFCPRPPRKRTGAAVSTVPVLFLLMRPIRPCGGSRPAMPPAPDSPPGCIPRPREALPKRRPDPYTRRDPPAGSR